MQKAPYVFPIVGGRKPEHLRANLEALDLTLTDAHYALLESVLPFPPLYPYNMIVSPSWLACSSEQQCSPLIPGPGLGAEPQRAERGGHRRVAACAGAPPPVSKDLGSGHQVVMVRIALGISHVI